MATEGLAPTSRNFFNNDNKADILWQNLNGDVELWNSNSGSESFTGQDLGVVGGGWHVRRPSIDPELTMRMLIVGYCFGITL